MQATIERVKSPDTIKAQKVSNGTICDQYRSMAVDRYTALFQSNYGRPPMKPYIMRQIASGRAEGKKRAKFVLTFNKIILFLNEELKYYNAANNMYQLLTDYFNCVLLYYGRFGRRPTMNQIGPGPTNMDEFKSFTFYEQNQRGGYWMDAGQKKRADDLIKNGGALFKDIFLDVIRIENGMEPIFGTTEEDIKNWNGKPI